VEHRAYSEALQLFAEERIEIRDNRTVIKGNI